MMKTPNMELKRMNRNRIFRFVLQQKTTSKSEIAYQLRISLPTVIQNITALKGQNLILEDGEYESTGGRRAKMLSVNALAKVALGIDITRNHISVVIVDLLGNIVDSARESIKCCKTEQTLEKIQNLIEHMLQANQILDDSVLGVGVSLPAIIAEDYRTIETGLVVPFPEDFYEQMKAHIKFPFLFYNDANCGGFAELWSRKPTNQDMFYFSLSGTVGGAMLINDQIYTGERFTSGEVGHMTLMPNGRNCYCGQKGCVDAYCNSNCLAELTNGDLPAFFDLLKHEEIKAQKLMAEYLDYLTIAIHNVRMLLDCDIILGGYIGSYSDLFLEHLQKRLQEVDTFHREADYVTGCHYNTEASAVGAALMYVSKFIDQVC